MASADLGRGVEKVVRYPPLSELGALQRRQFYEALLEAASFEDLPTRLFLLPDFGGTLMGPAAQYPCGPQERLALCGPTC